MDYSRILIYFSLLVVFFISIIASETKKRLPLFIMVLLLSFIAGFRDEIVGIDTAEYYHTFKASVTSEILYMKDVVFVSFVKILMTIFKNPTVLFVIFSLIIKSSKNK